MIHYDLKKNNGYSETKKKKIFCVCMCVCVFSYQLKKTFHTVK